MLVMFGCSTYFHATYQQKPAERYFFGLTLYRARAYFLNVSQLFSKKCLSLLIPNVMQDKWNTSMKYLIGLLLPFAQKVQLAFPSVPLKRQCLHAAGCRLLSRLPCWWCTDMGEARSCMRYFVSSWNSAIWCTRCVMFNFIWHELHIV